MPICHVCREEQAQLSYEHVPPRAAFNEDPTTVYGLDDWLARGEDGEMPGGRIEQRGAGGHTLCERCNNVTGSWYGNELARAVRSAVRILLDAPLKEFDQLTEYRWADVRFRQSETGPYPLRIIKQIVTMLLATSPHELSLEHPELGDFVLDRSRTGLSDRYRLYLSLFAGPNARSTGVVAHLDLERGREDILVEVAWPPYAYVMTIDSEPDAIDTTEITSFVGVGYNQRADVELSLLIGFGHTPFPGDYRTSANDRTRPRAQRGGELEVDRREIQLVGALHRRERDGEVLNRQPRRVEDCDVAIGAPALRSTYKYVPELSDVTPVQHACLHAEHEVAVVGSLLPVVGVDAPTAWCSLRIALLAVGALVAGVFSASAGASVDPAQRTVTAGAFQVQWSQTDPEEIVSLSWSGSPNLTNFWTHPFCPQGGDHEFFGDSWDTFSDARFRALVGWGSTGTWDYRDPNGVAVASAASGCYGTSGIPVHTSYQFFENGREANRILLQRRISFGMTPFPYDLRAYIPRLYPRDQYSLVVHPNTAGTNLVTEVGNDCEFGCEVTDWNGTWFAVHDPIAGRGMIVRHAFSTNPVALWVDMDGGSQTTASGVLLVQPPSGFTGTVVEVESLCFYDSSIWTPSLTLPNGC